MVDYGKWLPHLQPIPAAVGAASAVAQRSAARRQDELLDEALKETFPASDPISVIRIS